MTKSIAVDRLQPLTDDVLLHERVTDLLRRASVRQVWMLFLTDDDVQAPVLLPCDDLPADPNRIVDGDLGRSTAASVLGARIAALMREFGFAQAVFAWERPGDAVAGAQERTWAHALAVACAEYGARVRAQFLVHDRGVRALTPDDYLDG